MQICFSIASKASTITQHISDNSPMMPSLSMNDQIERLVADSVLNHTPTGLVSQMKIMEELGKRVRDTPNDMMTSESISILAASQKAFLRDTT